MHPIRTLASTVALLFAAGPAATLATEPPEPVSPGAAKAAVGVTASCPTFTWGLGQRQAAATRELELVVYRVEDSGSEPVQVLVERLPASARAWTPSSERCLEAGATYAWSVGARADDGGSAWSEALLFRVVVPEIAPEIAEQVLATLRGHLTETGSARTEREPAAVPAATEAGPESSSPGPGALAPEAIPAGSAAILAELPDLTGVTFGIEGISHSPDGVGVLGHNDNGGIGVAASGATDLLLDGLPAAALTESGFSRASPGDLVFEFSNPDAGDLALRVEGSDVLTEASGAAKSHTHDGTDVNDGTLPTGKIDPAGAVAGEAVVFDGANAVWGLPTAGGLVLPYAGAAAVTGPVVSIENTGATSLDHSAVALETPGGTGLHVSNSRVGVNVQGVTQTGVTIDSGASAAVWVSKASTGLSVVDAALGVNVTKAAHGVRVLEATLGGVSVTNAGSAEKSNAPLSDVGIGFRVDGAAAVGQWIGYAGHAGINIEEAGSFFPIPTGVGLRIGKSWGLGVEIADARSGVKVTTAAEDGFIAGTTGGDGFIAEAASGSGLKVVSASSHGVLVENAVDDGLRVDNAGNDGIQVSSFAGHGVHVAGAGEHGLFVGNADRDGLHIAGFADSYANGVGIFVSNGDITAKVAHFDGEVEVAGNLIKPAGTFRIDHPVDPENRYLSHSFVESPDMMNIYNGNVTLDASGSARVDLPGWFEALNRDFRYQLTAIGGPGPGLYVARKVDGNSFEIAGGEPGLEVSWQLTGVRRDAYAEAYRTPVETWKKAEERGYYLHPAAFGLPPERGIAASRHARRPAEGPNRGAKAP